MTSKANSPPSYEEALHHPKSEDCSYLPPPSYSPSPGMYPGPPGYWSQGGVFPQAGVSPGFSPSIPTLSAALPASHSGDMEEFFRNQWESTSVRHAFIRKVYLILAVQLSFTFTVVAVFTFVDPVRQFVIRYPGIYWASLAVYFVVYCVLICLKEPRRRFPWNLLLLGIFTLALSYMAGTISSYYETKAVFIAMGITAVVCVAVTVFCFQTKVDLTSCSGLLCISGVLLMIIGIVTAVVLSFQYVPWLHMLYAAIGAVVYTLFLVYNTQLLIGNRELSISPEEYVFGALSLYVDIVHIFLFILQVSGSATE
ncbi:protein lifeguard 3 [Oryzias melastigma]|uniref:Transmembrane BAX inhibitor motif containing 1b n=1 Tax=Oryzias melastigma TaxID=30732 RepID=A0A3B3DPI0_ORYME|nr:protein lifeguard 3 [Oryzias melastigma]XP_024142066.1 protein lifeguard 3 [Oryzias melastigma]XP_024142067.1 protein lifeguard 3 [Oryzias melastigma]XP_024142068.1 protein lifeguard 3 [Oryzias melastigma]